MASKLPTHLKKLKASEEAEKTMQSVKDDLAALKEAVQGGGKTLGQSAPTQANGLDACVIRYADGKVAVFAKTASMLKKLDTGGEDTVVSALADTIEVIASVAAMSSTLVTTRKDGDYTVTGRYRLGAEAGVVSVVEFKKDVSLDRML